MRRKSDGSHDWWTRLLQGPTISTPKTFFHRIIHTNFSSNITNIIIRTIKNHANIFYITSTMTRIELFKLFLSCNKCQFNINYTFALFKMLAMSSTQPTVAKTDEYAVDNLLHSKSRNVYESAFQKFQPVDGVEHYSENI